MVDKKREFGIDLLRLCGLLCIMLAHVQPPAVINQIRNFDVPLMVIVAGLSLSASHTSNLTFWQYLKKRVPRLVLPVWTFLIIFFIYTFLLFSVFNKPYPFSEVEILDSFMLLHGIGYVWIFRIFLLVALTSWALNSLNCKLKSNIKYFGVLFTCWLIYELLIYIFESQLNTSGIVKIFIYDILLYMIPYTIFFGIGIRLSQLSTKFLILILVFLFVGFSSLSIYFFAQKGYFILTQTYKYPPKFYYSSYSIFISILLYISVFKMNILDIFKRKYIKTIILFLNTSSMWIYLWHIFVLYNLMWAGYSFPPFLNNYIAKFIIVCFLSVILTFFQKSLLKLLSRYFNEDSWGIKTIKICF